MEITIIQGETRITITTDKVRVMWHNTTHVDPDDPEWWADEWEDSHKS